MSTGFPGYGESAPVDVHLAPAAVESIARRLRSGQWDAFADQAARVGHCANPIHLEGSSIHVDRSTGEVTSEFSSSNGPVLVRCGNRRSRVCPSCSRIYGRDMFEVVRCGVTGGKGVSSAVGDNPLLFVTLTAPSFGPVHSRRGGRVCRPTGAERCVHGRPARCPSRHGEEDARLGEPICHECYRYDDHAVWQWWAPELWRRFTIALTRGLARRLDVPVGGLKHVARIQYAKVAEVQARGSIHFHALMRLDGPVEDGVGSPAPDSISASVLADLVTVAARAVRLDAPPSSPGADWRRLAFGRQLDVKVVRDHRRDDDPLAPVTAGQVAGYLAKYATKDAGDARGTGDSPHFAKLRETCRLIGAHARHRSIDQGARPSEERERDPYALMNKWARELGFRGHFATKSRRYSITLGALRRARTRFQALAAHAAERGDVLDLTDVDLMAEDDTEEEVVLRSWTFRGQGWGNGTDHALAVAVAARAREYDQWRAQSTSEHNEGRG